ncbi:hypothetical protein FQN50_006662 [Emmonsiellopsis sp. PD_5]|nr:hypothetical protein FQN50_006662 [Emmonsiellopsis sp. PD_5]
MIQKMTMTLIDSTLPAIKIDASTADLWKFPLGTLDRDTSVQRFLKRHIPKPQVGRMTFSRPEWGKYKIAKHNFKRPLGTVSLVTSGVPKAIEANVNLVLAAKEESACADFVRRFLSSRRQQSSQGRQ